MAENFTNYGRVVKMRIWGRQDNPCFRREGSSLRDVIDLNPPGYFCKSN